MTAGALRPAEIAALLSASAVTLEAELRALGDTEAAWHPAPGEWCVKEILGHLVEAEQRGFAGRIRTILATDRPALLRWDPAAVAAARGDCARPWPSLWDEFRQLRDESVALVRSLRPADLARSGRHPEVGELTIGDLLQEWVHHDRNHVKQALGNVQARVWPHMGNARRFSQPDA